MRRIGGLFGRSPFGPLHEHMMKVEDCLDLLKPLMEAFINQDYEKLKKYSQEVSVLEHEADLIKEGIRENLSKSFRASIERSDILMYLREQDSVADKCEDIAKLLVMRKMKLPKVLNKPLLKLTEKVLEAVEEVKKATNQFKSLWESPFSKKEASKILEIVDLIAKKEWEADDLQLDFAQEIFQVEKETSPITIFFLMNMGKEIGAIADHAENVGDCLRRLINH